MNNTTCSSDPFPTGDLSAAFDTIDLDNLFYILEKYVGIGGSTLWLIRSYFSDRTQRVQIDGIMSDFASLLCGCHRAQFWEQ